MLLIGQRSQENQREKKIKKTKIYRQMLDHQILMNQQYRKDHSQKSREKDHGPLPQHVLAPSVIQKSTESLQHSIVHDIDGKQSQSKSRFLPLLKDKNTFYRGSSRFIKVEPANKTIKEARQYTQTQQIDEQQQSQIDYAYDSTCQRIIKELQSIKNKPAKPRTRKRLYEFGQAHMQRRAHEKHLSNQQRYQQSLPYMKPIITNPTANPESRYYQYLSTDLSSSQKPYNQFQQPRVDTKINRNLTKINTPATDFKQYQKSEKPYQAIEGHLLNEPKKERNHENKLKVSSIAKENYENTLKADKKKNVYQKSNQQQQEPQISVIPSRKPQKLQEKTPLKKIYEKPKHKNIEAQRQTFLELLRRVKNRGQSLYLKFAKCSPQKQALKS